MGLTAATELSLLRIVTVMKRTEWTTDHIILLSCRLLSYMTSYSVFICRWSGMVCIHLTVGYIVS